MAASETAAPSAVREVSSRPKRADARRNYDKVVASAREAFAEGGSSTSLEDIARRAGVGIGTLYRNFPNRQSLLEAVYVGEVEDLARSAEDFAKLPPWEGLVGWLHRFMGYLATKRALADQMLEYLDRSAPFFQGCRALMFSAGEPLLARAQEAGVVRADIDLEQITHLVMGISRLNMSDPDAIGHILDVALDGLRYRPAD
jgi:AcrR family transcriptional regulator